MDFATVFKTFNSAEANLIVTQLEAAGFNPRILNELSTLTLGMPSTSGGIQVQVPQAQSTDARALLDSTVNSGKAPEDPATPPNS